MRTKRVKILLIIVACLSPFLLGSLKYPVGSLDIDFGGKDLSGIGGMSTEGDVGVNTAAPQSLLDVQGDAGAAGIVTIATKELTVVDGDELGRIDFNAPLEEGGTDAILPGASIWAEADATFDADTNTTSLVFATGTSAAATEKMRLDSAGNLAVSGNVLIDGTLSGRARFHSYSSAQTLTTAVDGGGIAQVTAPCEITFIDCSADNVGVFVTVWVRDAEQIEMVPASGDAFVLFNGTATTTDDEVDLSPTAGNKVTIMCTASNTASIFSETYLSTDGGVAD